MAYSCRWTLTLLASVTALRQSTRRDIGALTAGVLLVPARAVAALPSADRVPLFVITTADGSTPLFTVEELASADVSLVLYPLSAFRAMNKAAQNVYEAVRRDGTQKHVVDIMQTRAELYEAINYHDYERKLDALFSAKQ